MLQQPHAYYIYPLAQLFIMGASAANETMGRLVLFVVILAISATLALSSDARNAVMDIAEYVYEKIAILFGFDVSDDSKTAIDSTKTLACAIDVTAYWSSQNDNDLGARLSYIADPTQPDAPKDPTLFREVGDTPDTQGRWFASCVGNVETGYGIFSSNAVKTNSGGLLGKLSEWSGGGDDKITGNLFEAPESCNIYGIADCLSEDGPANTYVCSEGDANIICCEKDLIDKDIYCCDNGYKDVSGQCMEMSTSEIEGEADQIVADHPGTAMRFGKTAVVCEMYTPDPPSGKECYNVPTETGSNLLGWKALAEIPLGLGYVSDAYSITNLGAASCGANLGWSCYRVDGSTGIVANPLWAAAVDIVPGTLLKANVALDDSVCWGKELKCTVKAFELPQDVDTDIGLLGSAMEFVVHWFSWYGEPKYLVYHETFPTGLEGIWTYDTTEAILTVAAVGGALNVGLSPLKVGYSALKGTTVHIIKNRALRGSLTKGESAAYQSFIKHYGTSKVLERYIISKSVMALAGKEAAEGVFMQTFRKGVKKKIFDAVDSPQLKNLLTVPKVKQTALLDDYGNLIRSEIDIDPALAKQLAKERGISTAGINFDDVADELGALRTLKISGDLLTEADATLIKVAIKEKVKHSGVFDRLIKKDLKIAVGKEGKIERMRRYVGLGGRSANLKKDLADRKADEITKEAYKDLMRFVYDLPGDVADDTTARGAFVDMYSRNWKALYDSPDGSTEVMEELGDRGLLLAKGITGLPPDEAFISITKRKALLGTTLGLTYLGMLNEFSTEKYGTCGTGTLCMHKPRLLGDDIDDPASNNFAFDLANSVKSAYSGLVMTKIKGITGSSVMRLNLISPCKTDIVVAPKEGGCSCENYYGSDEIAYKIDKLKCVVDISPYTEPDGLVDTRLIDLWGRIYTEPYIPVIAPGVCPNEVTGTFWFFHGPNTATVDPHDLRHTSVTGTFDVITAVEDWSLRVDPLIDSYDRFSCTPEPAEDMYEALERCFDEEIYESNGDLKKQFKECYGPDRPTIKDCDNVELSESAQGNAKYTEDQTPVHLLDARPVPLNLKPNVLDNDRLVPVAECSNSWIPDTFMDSINKPCILATVDRSSMESYHDSGFGSNFCLESKDDANDWIEGTCEVGTIIGSGALMFFSFGVGTPIALFVVGAGGTVCTKLANQAGQWPNNQF